MIIERNFEFFELTPRELMCAYQEHIFDRNDVIGELQAIIDEHDMCSEFEEDEDDILYYNAAKAFLADDDMISIIARDKRRNMDKYDMSWEYATSEAVRDAIHREYND